MAEQKMFNAAQKECFLEEQRITGNMLLLFRNVFNLVAPYEEKLNADISTWGEDDLREMLESLAGFRGYSSKNRENLLKRYIRWCVAAGTDGASGAIFGVTLDGLARFREMTLAGPEHLQKCLNAFLPPESDMTVDNTLRGYCWLAFSGMSDTEIVGVTVDDVDLNAMKVRCGDTEYPLYAESIACMRILCEMTCFKYFHPGYEDDFTWRVRPDGNKLLRGLRSAEPALLNMRSRLSNKSTEAFREGKTDVKISFYRIWISGEFYRMFQSERMGERVDFDYLAERAIRVKEESGKPYKLESGKNRRTQASKLREISRNYRDDYARWKIAYGV